MERLKIGINGIDEMIEGGIPKESIIGLTGPPGVGKSIFALHYILEGARNGEKSVYINLEEPLKNVNRMIKQFEFSEEFLEFIKNDLIVIKCFEYTEYDKIDMDILKQINDNKKIKRLVIDSFNCFFNTMINNEDSGNIELRNIRKRIAKTFSILRKISVTSILILEESNHDINLSHNIPYFIDGNIVLDFLDLGTIERRVFVPKMRWTDQFKESKTFIINKKGISIIDDNI